jgi:integrase/recombinase XerD
MKIDRHDQAKILSKDEINRLFSLGLKKPRDSEALLLTADRALFGVCLYTGTRIAEACALHTKDVYSIDGSVRPRVTIRRGTTKGKMSTRSVPVNSELRKLLEDYSSPKVYLFPGRHGRGHIHPDSADKILRAAFIELRIEGASTHSFRRTCLTQMHKSGVPLKVIQQISGHRTLAALQKYLEVLDEDLEAAVDTLVF